MGDGGKSKFGVVVKGIQKGKCYSNDTRRHAFPAERDAPLLASEKIKKEW